MRAEGEGTFAQLVLSLYGSAWIALGKVPNPLSGKVERDLEAARHAVDVLEMLKEKCRGNLEEEEAKLLTDCLSNIQMNYFKAAEAEKTDGGKISDP